MCTGAFFLAAAGLLDGRQVTTHRECAAELAERFPNVRVESDRIFIKDGPLCTAAGVSAGMDLALALVEEDFGRELPLAVAPLEPRYLQIRTFGAFAAMTQTTHEADTAGDGRRPRTAPSSMMAWRVHEYGPPNVMRFERIPRPDPGRGEVLVRVEAAGVGPWDGWIRAGQGALPEPLPLTLGSDLAGEVVAVGPGVSRPIVGEQVYGVTNSLFLGAYAEYALASAAMVSSKPASLSYIEAAGVPVVAVTARQALFDHAKLSMRHTVVIHGGAGSVGAYAVQLARQAGLYVVATASADDAALVRELGADMVIDYRTERFEDKVQGADAVIDLVGGDMQKRSFQVLRRGARLISAVSEPDRALALRHGVEAAFFLVKVTTAELAEIARLIDDRKLRTGVSVVLPLADARQAHLMLDGQRPRPKGKIVLATRPV